MAARLGALTSSHITLGAFSEQLFSVETRFRRIFNRFQPKGKDSPYNVGVCVSGGSDSMALAYLLRHTAHPTDESRCAFSLHAFIVDHGMRDGSTLEALRVQKYLQEMSIDAQILTMKWEDCAPDQTKGLENVARAKRYQLIASEALKRKCKDIFVGQHHDDQIETLLYRLTRNNNPSWLNLHTMDRKSAIPCCEKIFGAQSWSNANVVDTAHQRFRFAETFHDGIHLHRPLLPFRKSQILSTCAHFAIPYVDDHTNHDPTFTTRNAIRKMRTHTLPKALQSQGLHAFQQRLQSQSHQAFQDAVSLARRALHLCIHGQYGLLCVEIDRCLNHNDVLPFSYLMGRLVEFVSPLKTGTLPLLLQQDIVQSLIPYVFQPDHPISNSSTSSAEFQQDLVVIRKVPSESGHEHRQRFQLFRQPMRRIELHQLEMRFEPAVPKSCDNNKEYKSRILLWDGRFWLRIWSKDINLISQVEVRPFAMVLDKARLNKLRTNLGSIYLEDLQRTTPPEAKRTIPVLTLNGAPVAFPTLGTNLEPSVAFRYEVHYACNNRTFEFFSKVLATESLQHKDGNLSGGGTALASFLGVQT